MRMIRQNYQYISFEAVTNFINENDNFDINLNEFYQKTFIELEKVEKEVMIL